MESHLYIKLSVLDILDSKSENMEYTIIHNNRRHTNPASAFMMWFQYCVYKFEILTSFSSGFGTTFMFYSPISICVGNFPARMRGTIIGVTSCFDPAGIALFGIIYARFFQEGPTGNFFLCLAILCIVANLLSILVLRPLPQQPDGDILREEYEETYSVCFVTDEDNNPANSWHMRLGIGVMKIPAFHILSWCFLLSAVPQLAIINNVSIIATSFGHTELALSLQIYGPVMGLLAGLAIGFISDKTHKYVSRLVYVVIGHLPQLLFHILSIFCGENPYIFSGLVLSSFINCGFLSTIIPTLITEYFGSHYYMRIWGAEKLTSALLVTILNTIIGALYQAAITDGGTECYGLACFQSSFILESVMAGLAPLLCGIMWYKERKRGQEYKSLASY